MDSSSRVRARIPGKHHRSNHQGLKQAKRTEVDPMEKIFQKPLLEAYKAIIVCHNECDICGKWYSQNPQAGTWYCDADFLWMNLLAGQLWVGYNHD